VWLLLLSGVLRFRLRIFVLAFGTCRAVKRKRVEGEKHKQFSRAIIAT
jgi:hypothetical protein